MIIMVLIIMVLIIIMVFKVSDTNDDNDTDLYGRNTAVPASSTGLSTQSRRLNP